jgi:CBS domain-containing protein
MQASGMNALVVLDSQGRPSGVVTDTDFRTKALGMPPSTPVKAIMTSPVLSVDAKASCFDALLTMTRHCLRHVVVLEERRAVGLVSAQELLLLRVGSPPALAAAVAAAPGLDELAAVAARLPGLALGLLREGARAGSLGRIAGGLRERLIARLAELAEARLGPPPVGYCLMLLGPAARRDGPALTPGHGAVWTGIIHEDAPSLRRATGALAARPLKSQALADLAALPGTPGLFGSVLSVDEYFKELGRLVAQGLAALGMAGPEDGHGKYSPTPSAGERTWRGGLAYWKGLYAGWSGGAAPLPDPGLLDFRPVHGQLWLSEALRAEVGTLATLGSAGQRAPGQSPAEVAPGPHAPCGHRAFLARLAQEAGEDLPALLRMLALSAGVPRIGSVERAVALGRVHPLVRDMAEETVHAMEYLAARQWLEASGPPSPLAAMLLGLCRAVSRRLAGRLPQWFGPEMYDGQDAQDGQDGKDGHPGRTKHTTGQAGRSGRSTP